MPLPFVVEAITFRAAVVGPPMTLFGDETIRTPWSTLPRALAPVTSVPM